MYHFFSGLQAPLSNQLLQGCSQHPKYKGGNLVDKVVKWPIFLSCGYNVHTMDWSNHVLSGTYDDHPDQDLTGRPPCWRRRPVFPPRSHPPVPHWRWSLRIHGLVAEITIEKMAKSSINEPCDQAFSIAPLCLLCCNYIIICVCVLVYVYRRYIYIYIIDIIYYVYNIWYIYTLYMIYIYTIYNIIYLIYYI